MRADVPGYGIGVQEATMASPLEIVHYDADLTDRQADESVRRPRELESCHPLDSMRRAGMRP